MKHQDDRGKLHQIAIDCSGENFSVEASDRVTLKPERVLNFELKKESNLVKPNQELTES
jgi:hypothetical protein